MRYCNASHNAFVRFFSSSKTYINLLSKYNIDCCIKVLITDNFGTKINLFTNISHKPLFFLFFINSRASLKTKDFESNCIYHQ